LQGSLVSGFSKASKEIADFLLAGIDDLSGGSLVDGLDDSTADFFELGAEGLDKDLGGHRG